MQPAVDAYKAVLVGDRRRDHAGHLPDYRADYHPAITSTDTGRAELWAISCQGTA
jgi:hypothetical protein